MQMPEAKSKKARSITARGQILFKRRKWRISALKCAIEMAVIVRFD
jgi:hypothetical protein